MVALFCHTRRMQLDPQTGDIGQLKANIVPVLTSSAFTDVINNDLEIAGNRAGMRLSILHLPIEGRSFYQQVMAAGTDGAATQALVDEIVRSIST